MVSLETTHAPDTVPTVQSSKEKPSPTLLSSTLYFLKTLYLLTLSDLDTFCIPQTAFGIFGALSGPILTTDPSPSLALTLARLPQAFLWVWLNTVVFDLANQRLPASIKEDSINKPWRPLSAGRLTTRSATHLLLAALPLTFLASLALGAVDETVLLFAFTYMYNDLTGSDHNVLIRNALIAGMYVLYSAGAMRVACAATVALNPVTYQWLALVAAVIFSTMHVQDLKDVEGDRARDRKTLPLVVGSEAARWVIAAAVSGWSVASPAFWGLGLWGYALSGLLAVVVAGRVVVLRSRSADRTTWKVWSLWLTSLYFLPVWKGLGL